MAHLTRGALAMGRMTSPAMAASPRSKMTVVQRRPLLSGLCGSGNGSSFRPLAGLAQRGAALRMFSVAAAAPAAVAAAPARPRVAAVQSAHGFKLERQQFIKEYDSDVLLYRHEKTGAELISVVNSDENKTFGVVLRTPVDNSYGIPHILEHSVLCGSRKYPIKEPFVELMKGSLNTFLNAFTYPDRTCYPVASCNTQDFYNLVDVYLDAVFHPRCIDDIKTFEQEGWHLEMDKPEDELTYKGVVFNEMKGVYSSPDSVFYRTIQKVLFPDNTYMHDSGGDPAQIPALTYPEFQAFHAKYYHPSNSRLWFYGDDDPTERLRILDAYLSEFERRPDVSDSAIATQARLPAPTHVTEYYAAGEGEEGEEQKAYTAVNWVLTDTDLDVETELALGFLDYLLLGTPAAPLRRALNDSNLGAAVVGGGIDDDLKQPCFSLGLKGVDPANVPKVEALVLSQLEALATSGFSATAVEAALNTIEFSLRENNTGSFPRGLSLMLRAVGAWIYDRDPFKPLEWEDALQHFKGRVASGEDVFGPLIRKYLLNNTHRVTVTLLPDAKLGDAIEGSEKARLAALREGLGAAQLDATVANTHELKTRQETPDTPEALSCVPMLKLSDIPRTISHVPTAVSEEQGATLLAHELFTNNVLYVEAALDMRPVPERLLPLVPLFCRSLTQMGTTAETFVELTERLGRKTGGLSVYPWTTAARGREEPVAYVMVRGKAMGDKAGDLFDVARDILTTARLDDRDRFKQMVNETKAGLESSIVGSGHSFAGKRLSAQRTTAGYVSELMGGVTYLEYIRTLVKRVENDWEGVKADLHAIRDALLQRKGAIINLTGDGSTLAAAQRHAADFLSALPSTSSSTPVAWSGRLPRTSEALTVTTQVNYVARGANLYQDAGYELHGSAYVIEKYLGTTWLWDRVRVVGGAYGGFCGFDPQSGQFTYMSYRDPNLMSTLEAYDGTAAFLRQVSTEIKQDELTKAIIGCIGDVDSYQLPDAKGYSALSRHILGVTDGERQARRDEILSTSAKDLRAFADVLEVVRGEHSRVVAVTSMDKAKAINEATPGFWDIKKIL